MTDAATHTRRSWFFLIVSAAGLITAWVFNGLAVIEGANYLDAWFGSSVDWVLSLDLLIVAIAGSAWMVFEAKRLGMRFVWAYILASGLTAFAFTFPLFLAMRERTLSRSIESSD
jgi:hypothetical protein